jgi:hypothetical protein
VPRAPSLGEFRLRLIRSGAEPVRRQTRRDHCPGDGPNSGILERHAGPRLENAADGAAVLKYSRSSCGSPPRAACLPFGGPGEFLPCREVECTVGRGMEVTAQEPSCSRIIVDASFEYLLALHVRLLAIAGSYEDDTEL